MPTECERSVTSPSTVNNGVVVVAAASDKNTLNEQNLEQHLQQQQQQHQQQANSIMDSGDMSTSQTSTTSNGSSGTCNGGRKTSITSPDPTAYVAKARVTRPTPPPPPHNPMQFVQIKPCNLYQTAQEQLKKAEEVKKIKEIRKEEPEDWQNNLDNWKSSRRKRVEHIIDRVVEVKKLELEEHDRTRRKSKTFNEMMEERNDRPNRGLTKLASLAVYAEDEANDLSDLGIGTSSASGKSSLSEDYDNNSVMSDNAAELDKAITNSSNNTNNGNSAHNSHHHIQHRQNSANKPNNHTIDNNSTTREYISSPGYETSSSTAPASSPDPCEYTYEGAIQDYKQRVSRAASGLTSAALQKLQNAGGIQTKETTPERLIKQEAVAGGSNPPRRGSKIEDRLFGFEVQSPSEEYVEGANKVKVDVPKIDISKRKEIFESANSQAAGSQQEIGKSQTGNAAPPRLTLRDRFKVQDAAEEQPLRKETKRLSGDISSIKERLQSLEQQKQQTTQNNATVNGANGAFTKSSLLSSPLASSITITATTATMTTANNKKVDIPPVPPLKERLSSLQNAATKEEVRKPPVALVDARQLEIMKNEEEKAKLALEKKQQKQQSKLPVITTQPKETVAVSASLKETTTILKITEESNEIDRDDSGIHTAEDIEVDAERLQSSADEQIKLNAAIEALALEEKQFAEAANAVNQIEAEFDELSIGSMGLAPLPSSGLVAAAANPAAASVSASVPAAAITSSTNNNDHMEYSVSSTNQFSSSSNSSGILCENSSSGCGSSLGIKAAQAKVQGSSNLRRKPTNEMVHAKNLLKIFNDTFQDDIELDEDVEIEQTIVTKSTQITSTETKEHSSVLVKSSAEVVNSPQLAKPSLIPSKPPLPKSPKNPQSEAFIAEASSSQGSQNSQASKDAQASQASQASAVYSETFISESSTSLASQNSQSSKLSQASQASAAYSAPMSPTMIPRSITPSAERKNPMSPLAIRSTTRFRVQTPPTSPSLQRKSDSPFNINGRVEIFNSKNMNSTSTPCSSTAASSPCSIPKPMTPTMTAKKTHLPYIATAANAATSTAKSGTEILKISNAAGGNIKLPTQDQPAKDARKQAITATTKTTTVNSEPLLSTSETSKQHLEQQQPKKHDDQMKSMPSQQMANEPKLVTIVAVVGETIHHTNDAMKHQQTEQSQQHEQHNDDIVICAPPITILNQDELPKPNTVKNLSSCFQQQQQQQEKNVTKPLARSRIPHATPPQSPLALKKKLQAIEEKSSLETVKNYEKQMSLISTSSNNSNASALSSSCSSSPSVVTMLDMNKKLSTISNSSTASADSNILQASIVKTKVQIHQGDEDEEEEEPSIPFSAKLAAFENQRAPVPTSPLPKVREAIKPLYIPTESQEVNVDAECALPFSAKLAAFEVQDNHSPSLPTSPAPPARKEPFKPSIPLSPKSELFKTTKPLVVSTLYDKYVMEPTSPKANMQFFDLPKSPTNAAAAVTTTEATTATSESPGDIDATKLDIDSALCSTLLTSLAAAPDVREAVEEEICKKVDKNALPQEKQEPITAYAEVSPTALRKSNAPRPSPPRVVMKLDAPRSAMARQRTVEEEICIKVDARVLPDGKQDVITSYKNVTPEEIQKIEKYSANSAIPRSSSRPNSRPNSKPNSPILQARAAHSKALIETCEKIIAEERAASSQMKSSLPSSPLATPVLQRKSLPASPSGTPKGTPVLERKSKIPKPIMSCCKAVESLSEADLKKEREKPKENVKTKASSSANSSPTGNSPTDDSNGVIARLHVVETQIKVTTTSPPASPAAPLSPKPQISPKPQLTETRQKKKNIFDFIKKNFGGGNKDSEATKTAVSSAQEISATNSPASATPLTPTEESALTLPKSGPLPEPDLQQQENKVLVLKPADVETATAHKIKYDEIHKIENSKFYLPSDDALPPPLPKTPAPVNIEITRKIITDEILEDGKSELDLTREIDDLLDVELNKLNHEIEELDKASGGL